MSLIERNQAPVHLSAHAAEVFDVTGAGDTVISVLGAAIAAQVSAAQAATIANLAAGIVVQRVGANSVNIHELRRAAQHESNAYSGILNEHQLKQAVIDSKMHKETIVMTNGCFDILHAGHIAYLEQAKQLGDRLIVAVNDDDSVKRLKGNNRPIKSLAERMDILAALRAVDWVISFSEDTPEKLISKILPDILVKGGDYKDQIHAISGAKIVKQNGGSVKILSFKSGFSTSKILQTIRGTQ
jgi:D-beta-D-heptose 7-phosphate kinase/D-beta-D-heptose 1-phosphate adenosyltransferase